MLEKILFVPDTHVPYHDKKAFALLLKVAKSVKFDRVVTLGDFADFFQVSFHEKKLAQRAGFGAEVREVNVCLDQLDKLGIKKKHYVAGNHEYRFDRYLTEKAPELTDLPGLSIPELLKLKERGWTYTPYKHDLRIGKLWITHDEGTAGPLACIKARSTYEGNVVIGHCLPVEYEVLTDRGFVRIDEVTKADEVLAYSGGRVVQTPVLDTYQRDYVGDMVCFNNQVISQEMTDDHKIYTKDGRYLSIKEALHSVTKSDLVRSAGPMETMCEYPVSDAMIRFVVAYCADGTQASKGSIRFNLKKTRKVARLTEILTELGSSIEWNEPGSNGAVKTKKLSRSIQLEVIRLAPEKRLPAWLLQLSTRQRQLVVDELSFWDGSELEDGSRQFSSYKPEELDLVQMLLAQHGILGRRHPRLLTYNVRDDRQSDATRPLKDFAEIRKTSRRVGCITTAHKNFFIRTPGGRVELSGNCHAMTVAYRGNARGEAHVGASFGWLGDRSCVDYMHSVKAKTWQLGFGIGNMTSNGVVHLQAVPIINNSCVVEGKLFK